MAGGAQGAPSSRAPSLSAPARMRRASILARSRRLSNSRVQLRSRGVNPLSWSGDIDDLDAVAPRHGIASTLWVVPPSESDGPSDSHPPAPAPSHPPAMATAGQLHGNSMCFSVI